MTYTAYNKMYVKGKPVGREYPAVRGTKNDTKTEVRERANKSNSRWNKWSAKQGNPERAKLVAVREVGKKRSTSSPRRKQRSMFGDFGGDFDL